MIEQILPAGVASAELFDDPPGLAPHPQEEALISRAVEKRRKEFITARHLGREAMGKLGVEPAPILRGERNVPLWPKGVVGSLTHCTGYRGAALAYALQVRSIGIDAEPHEPLPEGVLDSVSLPAERKWLKKAGTDIAWDKLLFCAKEATYKAWFPLTGRWLGFEDAHITFEAGAGGTEGTFHSDLLISGETHSGPPLASFDGRWIVSGDLILTTIAVQ
ncbi:4'-phosphopantetheinyl transferase family protein [Antrihabitans cavernicola]|uniref:4'-phosphopantetheinyl transferase superfamily protein n=1 Tax=Antrihabitans cavernicola TaxID=2495913 RepID=A0A5A7SF18_9NOCA|nr:4'-phosphopantetheinyl transferase superfamily protein [Spelaeibacter cavernicola]KAA0023297.1 4'-phosphopantetheinyl transferase superfamily protein [Spelaeibacter cavernicola]